MKKKIATMLIMCCLISGMITDSVVYGADCGAVLNPFSGENLDEIIDELEELTYLTEDYNFFAPNGYVKSIEISDGINQISGNKKNFIKKYI